MCIVGGGGNIAITTALAPTFFVMNCFIIHPFYVGSNYLIFIACLMLLFLDVEANPGRRHFVPAVCWILCSNVRGLSGNLRELTLATSQYLILLCSEIFVSDMRHMWEFLGPWFSSMFYSAMAGCLVPEGWLHTFETDMEHFASPN